MTILERAKAQQLKAARETAIWVSLDLLEGLIAEIERLQQLAPPSSLKEITVRLEKGARP